MRALAFLTTLGLVVSALPRDAAATTARHQQVVVQKLRDAKKKVIGARFHMVLDPGIYHRVQVKIGTLRPDPSQNNQDYIRYQIGERTGFKPIPGSIYRELEEMKLDVIYGRNNDLKPGEKINLYTRFNTPGGMLRDYWHVYGRNDGKFADGPSHMYELPSETSQHPEATDTP